MDMPNSVDSLQLWNASSNGNLFCHPSWQRLWWHHFGQALGSESIQITVPRNVAGRATAFGWFHRRRLWRRGVWPIQRLEFVGDAHEQTDVFPSEYLDILASRSLGEPCTDSGVREILRALNGYFWDDLIFANVLSGSKLVGAVREWAAESGYAFYQVDRAFSYAVDTTVPFESYIAGRSASTRRAMVNKRRVARERGLKYRVISEDASRDDFDSFARLHACRWNMSGIGPRTTAFLRSVLLANNSPWTAELSFLEYEAGPVSALFNVRLDKVLYNFQGGFLPDFDNRLALGTLHLGFEIERGCADPATDKVDFLAGVGMSTNYKERLATDRVAVSTLRVIRSPMLRVMTRLRRKYSGRRHSNMAPRS